jgi:predicted transcriptional regulator
MPAKPKRGRPFGRTVGERFSVRLPPDLEDVLRRKAEAEDRPAAGIVRQALRQYLAEDLAQEAPETSDEELIAQAS